MGFLAWHYFARTSPFLLLALVACGIVAPQNSVLQFVAFCQRQLYFLVAREPFSHFCCCSLPSD